MSDPCRCHRCLNERGEPDPFGSGLPYTSTIMVLCSECRNKRCPHASDHRFACTNSNAPGQPGSVYGPTP